MKLWRVFRRHALEPALFCPRSGHLLRRVITPFGDFLACFPCNEIIDRADAVRAGTRVPTS